MPIQTWNGKYNTKGKANHPLAPTNIGTESTAPMATPVITAFRCPTDSSGISKWRSRSIKDVLQRNRYKRLCFHGVQTFVVPPTHHALSPLSFSSSKSAAAGSASFRSLFASACFNAARAASLSFIILNTARASIKPMAAPTIDMTTAGIPSTGGTPRRTTPAPTKAQTIAIRSWRP
jgi:hypothetical protein